MKKILLLINLLIFSVFSIAQSGSETHDGCEGDGYFVEVNGETYDESNPIGNETITGGAADGSDSTVVIDLTFNPTYNETITHDGCEGDGHEVTVDGTVYNEANPSGLVTLQTVDGCDSIINIDLTYKSPGTNLISYTGCEGDGHEETVDGTVYNEANPSDIITLTGAAANGCDSIITIDLTFNAPAINLITHNGCEGDGHEVTVDGTVYNEANPSDVVTLTGAAANGCDSIITIDLTFNPTYNETITHDGCEGDGHEVTVDGTVYNEANPSDIVTLQTVDGCDSIINIDLTYKSPGTNLITYTGCEGDGHEVTVDGTVYNEANPSDIITLTGAAANGCDSIITIDLTFNAPATNLITHNGCEGDGHEVIVDGMTYDESNPSGIDTLVGAAASGCDSIVTIDLTFNAPATNLITHNGCEGDGHEVIVDGTTYDESNPSGIDTIVGGAASGCDSIVTIDLTFDPALTGVDEIVACESYTWIDGVEYTSSNNTATETLTSVGGCDSIVTLDLTITPALDLSVDDVVNSSNDIVLVAQQTNATYRWLDCDDNFAPVSGQNNQTYIPSTNGSYAVRVSRGGCTDTSACVNVTTLSTSELSKDEGKLSIHPNPSEGVFNVSGYGKGTSNIIVMDALGRQVADVVVTKTSTKIDLSDKQSGVYFFSIIQDDERSLRKVILK